MILISLLHFIEFHCMLPSSCITERWNEPGTSSSYPHSMETISLIHGHGGGGAEIEKNTGVDTTDRAIEKQHGKTKMLINFFVQGVVTFVVVHLVWKAYEFVMSKAGVRWGNKYNSISVETCHLSLFGDWIAIWLIHWIGMSYYYGWKKGVVSTHKIGAPFVGERETHHRDWSTLFGLGGGSKKAKR